MKNPWNDSRKYVEYDHIPKATTPSGDSVITTKFVIPSNGSKIIAAFTAFLKLSTSSDI